MHRRILALWLPTLPTDRLRRYWARQAAVAAPSSGPLGPLAVMTAERGRLNLVAVDALAAAAGLAPGMPLADARALEPELQAVEADPVADARALAGLADWCGRYTPWTTTHGDDCILLDITGCAHLFGGEAGLARDLIERLVAIGYAGFLAVADTPGAAWAVSRMGGGYGRPGAPLGEALIPPGRAEAALAGLPIAALRLDPATVEGLERLGLRRIGDLIALPRGSLAARFGPEVLRRLDQALGRAVEPVSPRRPVPTHLARMVFPEAIGRTEDVSAALARLLDQLCAGLEQAQQGARRVELALYRVDGGVDRQSIGTSRPSRRPGHLFRLLAGRLDHIDAGFGIEVAVLSALLAEPLGPAQIGFDAPGGAAGLGGDDTPVDDLVDRLAGRLGRNAVVRPVPFESHLPEREVAMRPAMDGPTVDPDTPTNWPDRLRPVRLLPEPEPVEAVAPVPDDPPVLFRRGRVVHRIIRADGPERLSPEWWQDVPAGAVANRPRDYFRVEDTQGRRFWLYRAGLFDPDIPPRWYLHGIFP